MPIKQGVPFQAYEHLGLAGRQDSVANLVLTDSYQELVAAPAAGLIRMVNSIFLSNEDASVGTDFYFKLVKAGTDYVPVQIFLAPGEHFMLNFPFLLDSTVSIQAKVGVTCSGRAIAGYIRFYGDNGLLNFTGTSWSTLYTAANNKTIAGILVVNTDTTQQTVSIQIIDGSAVVKGVRSKTLSQGSSWIIDLREALPSGYSVQVKQGSADKTGSAFIGVLEV